MIILVSGERGCPAPSHICTSSFYCKASWLPQHLGSVTGECSWNRKGDSWHLPAEAVRSACKSAALVDGEKRVSEFMTFATRDSEHLFYGEGTEVIPSCGWVWDGLCVIPPVSIEHQIRGHQCGDNVCWFLLPLPFLSLPFLFSLLWVSLRI